MLTQSTLPRRGTRFVALGLAFLTLLVALATPAAGATPAPAAFEGSVDWDPQGPQVISDVGDTAFPWAAVDSNNVAHVIYSNASGTILYTNNAGGSFNLAGKRIDLASSTLTSVPFAAIAVGPNNVIHIVYLLFGKDNQIYYRRSTDGGQNWSARELMSGGGDTKSASPHLAVDADNNAHIVWIENACGQYNVYYRIRFGIGGKSGTQAPKSDCGTYQNRPQITVAGGKPHVVFVNGRDIYYRRRDSDGVWRGDNISGSSKTNSLTPTISSDGGANLFVAWDEGFFDGVTNHDILFKASFNGGVNWTAANNLSDNSTSSTAPHVTWSPAPRRAYIVWQDEARGGVGTPEIWEREFDPASLNTTAADQISHFSGRSHSPTIGAGPSRAHIVWMDEVDKPKGIFQVWDWGGDIHGDGCNGSLQLMDGDPTTRSTSLTGAITPANNCVPDQMQVSLDTPVTNATPKITYSPNIPAQSVQGGACVPHTVYVRLFKNGVGGQVFSDSINVDTAVNAIVDASNPHLIGLPTTGGAPGAQDGDPGYTRDLAFFLRISDADDCSGLQSFNIPGSTPSNGAISAGAYANTLPLPFGTTPPTMTINIVVSDKLTNSATYPRTIIFDSTPPVLDTSTSPTVTVPFTATDNIIVPLSFKKISVSDNLYGTPGSGRQFWGVWIANSKTNVAPNSPSLQWFPVEVSTPGQSFTIDWSLFGGITNPTGDQDYYVYVRFLDGAGNATDSADTIRVEKIHLEANFSQPTLYLPRVDR